MKEVVKGQRHGIGDTGGGHEMGDTFEKDVAWKVDSRPGHPILITDIHSSLRNFSIYTWPSSSI